MPTNDELHKADQQHAVAIAELKARMDGHADDIARHDRHLVKLDEAVTALREGFGKVSTKDDILELRVDIAEKFDKRLTDAHNSIPTKVATIFAAGTFLIMVITLVVSLSSHA